MPRMFFLDMIALVQSIPHRWTLLARPQQELHATVLVWLNENYVWTSTEYLVYGY